MIVAHYRRRAFNAGILAHPQITFYLPYARHALRPLAVQFGDEVGQGGEVSYVLLTSLLLVEEPLVGPEGVLVLAVGALAREPTELGLLSMTPKRG